jgi:AcrR family transcriptional regulator
MAQGPPSQAGIRTADKRMARSRRTRARLIDAGVDAIGRKGYANTTIDDIVGALPASRPTFYLHFKSKRDVIYALLERLGGRFMAFEPPRGDALTRPALHAWLAYGADYWIEHGAEIAVLESAAAQDEDIRALVDRATRDHVDALEQWLIESGDRPHARLQAMMLLMEQRGFLRLCVIDGWNWDQDAALDLLAEHWWSALKGTGVVEQPLACPAPARAGSAGHQVKG